MSQPVDLQTTSATDMLVALRSNEVSAVELCDAAIALIERHDGATNAVVLRTFDAARADAKAADEMRAKGSDDLLLGLPITVKESFGLKGYPSTWGFAEAADKRAREDSIVVRKLKAAGAVLLGKTNVPPALADWQSDNPVYGRTNNPYDLSRSPGGSSGGSAAAVASGYSALEVGTDIGGSVRIPAAFCGLFGLKTTYGIVSLEGHMPPGSDPAAKAPPLSVAGPLARTASDAMLALRVIAGVDPMLPASSLDLATLGQARPRDFRVLIVAQHPKAKADAVVLAALEDVAAELEKVGAKVARSSPLLPDLELIHRTYQKMLQTVINRRTRSDRAVISAHEWMDLEDAQLRFRRQWAALFEEFDIVLMPTFGTAAFAHMPEPDWKKRDLIINGAPTPYGDQMGWISAATFGNLPAAAFPAGIDANGMPISLQAIGPHLGDMQALAFAGLMARPVPPPRL